MANKDEFVIRWLEEPVEVACALCEGKRPIKFKKGLVVSLVSGELVCPKCAAINSKNLWVVCSSYARYLIELDQERYFNELKLDTFDTKGPMISEIENIELPKMDYQALSDDSLIFYGEDKCMRCANTFKPRNGPKK